MNELSIFIDESGDFGKYKVHSPYYIISMVFHNQSEDITDQLNKLSNQLTDLGYPDHCVHTGPIIRRENGYTYETINTRRKIFNSMITFIKHTNIRYKSFYIEKKHYEDSIEAVGNLSKQISAFIRENDSEFSSYDTIKIYYDNGQHEVSKLLSTVFNAFFQDVKFINAKPRDYRLFQAADLICSMKLLMLKMNSDGLSPSELEFFGNTRDLNKNYLKPLNKKEWI